MDKKDYHPGSRPQQDAATHPKVPVRDRVSHRQIVAEELRAMQEQLGHAMRMLRMKDVEYAVLEDSYFELYKDYSMQKVGYAELVERYDELMNNYNMLLAVCQTMRPRMSLTAVVYRRETDAEVERLTRELTHYREEVKVLEARIDASEQEKANLRYTLGDADAWYRSRLCGVLCDSITELMDEQDAAGNPTVQYARQWWAIYRILVDEYGLPDGFTDFCNLMDGMGLGRGSRIAHPCTVESLKKIEKPFDRPVTDWEALPKASKPCQRQYRVAIALRRIIAARLAA